MCRWRCPPPSPTRDTTMNTNERIRPGQELYTPNGDGYAMSATGVLILLAETLHPTGKPPPESHSTIQACNTLVQRVAAKAKSNGCPDAERWLDQLTDTNVQERIAAADQLVSWMTFSEFEATIRSIKS